MEVEEPMDVDTTLEESFSGSNNDTTKQILPRKEHRYENIGGAFATGIDIFSDEAKSKLDERAKRFGLSGNSTETITQQEQDLYTSMGLTEENENMKNMRLNVVHMRGTQDMSTEDVFKYFEDYAPSSIEWINDVSCNVVWLDNMSAARALLGVSKAIQVETDQKSDKSDGEIDMENNTEATEKNGTTEVINVKDIKCPLPPGLWRKGVDHEKSDGIFMRYATRSDKKQLHAEKLSDYYKKHGNPNFGGVVGILSESRKRLYKQMKHGKVINGNNEDEEMKASAKNPWGALSRNWGTNDSIEKTPVPHGIYRDRGSSGSSNVRERLGYQTKSRLEVPQEMVIVESEEEEEELSESESESISESSDSDSEWSARSKIPRMRMHADDEEEKMIKKKIKMQIKAAEAESAKDLRSRLQGKKPRRKRLAPVIREAIQIVVTNPQAGKPVEESEEEEGEIIDSEDAESEGKKQEESCEEGEINDEEKSDDEEIQGEETEEGEYSTKQNEESESSESSDSESDSSSDSSVSEKEVRGPKGSVIKVVQPAKPKLASTVWARLNNTGGSTTASKSPPRERPTRDLRETLKKGDLRSRLGNKVKQNAPIQRSPLRIEVKNDKYTEDNSD